MNKLWKVLIWIAVAVIVVTLVIPALWRLGSATFNWAWGKPNTQQVDSGTTQGTCPICPDCQSVDEPAKVQEPVELVAVVDSTCIEKASKIGAPIGSSICKPPTSSEPAKRMTSGQKIAFGTFTVDAETRVWILENFIVPNQANYSYDYTGREQNVLNAPFVFGSELNPVNGEPFKICFDTISEGCIPTVDLKFYN